MNPCFSQLQVAHVSASFVAGLASACVWILSVGWSFTLFWCFKLPTPPQTNIAMTKTPASAGNTSLKGPCFIAMIVYQSAFVISRCHGKASQWLVHPGWLGLFFGDESPLKPSYIFILGDENQPTRIPIFPPKCHINIGVSFTLLRSGLHASRCGEDSLHECCRLWSGFKRYHSHWLRHPSCLGWDDGRISSYWSRFMRMDTKFSKVSNSLYWEFGIDKCILSILYTVQYIHHLTLQLNLLGPRDVYDS